MAESPDKDSKTEEATTRRQQESRDKGQVAYSTEIVSALSLLAWVGTLLLGGGFIAGSTGVVLANTLNSLPTWGRGTMDIQSVSGLMREMGYDLVGTLASVILPVLALATAVAFSQVGFKITPQALSVDASKINPIKGIGRLFSMRSVVRTIMAVGKIAMMATAMVMVTRGQFDRILTMDSLELGPALWDLRAVVLRCVLAALIAIVVLAAFDFAYQRFQHTKDMRMSKQEIKDENKQSDGDPQLKARIRQTQREMAMNRMMQDVPSATVVVTNPTHYAVALSYERRNLGGSKGPGEKGLVAPRVVAKGVDLVAQRIKQVATDADVPLYEDVPLARALHAQCEIGDEIPLDLYQAVASVLAYVYRVHGLNERAGGGAA